MRLFWHLVRKEAHDVRWHVRGCLLLIVFLACLVQWLVNKGRAPHVLQYAGAGVYVWTMLAAFLGGGAVAAELFASDAASRRIEGAALLPIGPGRVFAAKAFVVVAATAVVTAWAAGVAPCVALLMASPDAAIRGASVLPDVPWIGLSMLTVVAAITLGAIVFEHGLGAVIGGVVAVGAGLLTIMRHVPWMEWGVFSPETLRHEPTWALAIASIPFTLVLGAAAAFAFVHGRMHLSRKLRRAVLGFGSASATIAGGGAIAWAAFEARMEVHPGDAHAVVANVIASPDGKHAVLMVGSWRAPLTSHAWLVDVETGRVTALPGHHMSFMDWTPDGGLRLWAGKWTPAEGAFGVPNVRQRDHVEKFDVATGKLVAVRSAQQIDTEPRAEGWARVTRSLDGWVVEWPERGWKQEFKGAWTVSASPKPGRICVWFTATLTAKVIDLGGDAAHNAERKLSAHTPSPGELAEPRWLDGGRRLRYLSPQPRLHVLDCDTGDDRDVQPLLLGNWPLGDGGHAVSGRTKDELQIVDLRDGRVVAGPWKGCGVWFMRGCERYALLVGADAPTAIVDLRTGRETRVEPDPDSYGNDARAVISALPGDRFLVLRPGNALDVIDADGKLVRAVIGAAR